MMTGCKVQGAHGTTNLTFVTNEAAIIAADRRLSDNRHVVCNEECRKILKFRQNTSNWRDDFYYTACGGLTENIYVQQELQKYNEQAGVKTFIEFTEKMRSLLWEARQMYGEMAFSSLVLGFKEDGQLAIYKADSVVNIVNGFHLIEDLSGFINENLFACGMGGGHAYQFVRSWYRPDMCIADARALAVQAIFESMCEDESTGGGIDVGVLYRDGTYVETIYTLSDIYALSVARFGQDSMLVVLPVTARYDNDFRKKFKRCFSHVRQRRTIRRGKRVALYRVTYYTPEALEAAMLRVRPIYPYRHLNEGIRWYGTRFYVQRYTTENLEALLHL